MREAWRTMLREPFLSDAEPLASSETDDDETPLSAVVSIVAVAAMALATIGAMSGGCTPSADAGWIVGASAAALLVAFAGTCVVTYQRRTWAHAATTFTAVSLVFVIVAFADRTSEMHRFVETGSACRTVFEGD